MQGERVPPELEALAQVSRRRCRRLLLPFAAHLLACRDHVRPL